MEVARSIGIGSFKGGLDMYTWESRRNEHHDFGTNKAEMRGVEMLRYVTHFVCKRRKGCFSTYARYYDSRSMIRCSVSFDVVVRVSPLTTILES